MELRTHATLNGHWDFWIDAERTLALDALPAEAARDVTVPAPWQSQSADLRFYTGVGWYRRTFDVSEEWRHGRIILGFDAVDYYTDVWVNDVHVGHNEGGYLPFEFDVTDAVTTGENTITVRVDDPAGDFPEIPHGKQSWYGPLSGIWQSVWLERRSNLYVERTSLTSDLSTGDVQVDVTFSAVGSERHHVEVAVLDADRQTVATARSSTLAGAEDLHIELTVDDVEAWSPDHPYLYTLEVRLLEREQVIDRTDKQFGFRSIEARDGRLFLNGEPLYLRGALDQDYYPDTIATPPSLEMLEDQVRKAKELGLNCLRCHIKIPDPRYLDVADRLGILIWAELPNWHTLTDEVSRRVKTTLRGFLARDGHRPSIVAWTIANEDWGLNLVHDASHRAWLKEMYRWLKGLDPTRLVVDNSPCEPNFHIETDLDDFHYYRAIPDHRHEWDTFVNNFATRLARTFSTHGDAVQTRREPLIISEFGNWGLPNVELLTTETGEDPWWFETGIEWGDAVVYPHGARQRFERWHLDKVFGSWQGLAAATQWHEYLSLKYEIEAMRRRSEIAGYVITELTDVHWECNGLLDMRRNPKQFHETFAEINADTVIIPDWERTSYRAGEQVQIGVTVAHGAGATIEDSEILWSLTPDGSTDSVIAPTFRAGDVGTVATAAVTAPDVRTATSERLNLRLQSRDGDVLASNYLDLAIFPPYDGPIDPSVTLWTPERTLAQRLGSIGYQMGLDPEEADVVVLRTLDEVSLRLVREGAHVLLLADHPGAVGAGFSGIQVRARQGTAWHGDWATSFAWLRREGPFARLPGGPLLDYAFDCVTPGHVLTGFGPWDFESNIHAGLFVGWVHKPAALIAERRYGQGKVVLTTFRLTPIVLGPDPTATTLFDALVTLTQKR